MSTNNIFAAASALLSARASEKQAKLQVMAQLFEGAPGDAIVADGVCRRASGSAFGAKLEIVDGALSCLLPSYVELPLAEKVLKDKIVAKEGAQIWAKAQADKKVKEAGQEASTIVGHYRKAVSDIDALQKEAIRVKDFSDQVDQHLIKAAEKEQKIKEKFEANKEVLTIQYADTLSALEDMLADW